MRKIIILLLVAVIFAGCNPCKRLWKICPPEVQYDSVYIETVKLDTLVLIVPSDTTYIEIPAVTLEGLGILIDNADQSITIKVEDGVFKAQVICKEDSLLAVIAEKEKLLSEKKTVIKEVEVEVEVKYVPTLVRILSYIGLGAVVLLIVYIIITIRSKGLKIALKRLIPK